MCESCFFFEFCMIFFSIVATEFFGGLIELYRLWRQSHWSYAFTTVFGSFSFTCTWSKNVHLYVLFRVISQSQKQICIWITFQGMFFSHIYVLQICAPVRTAQMVNDAVSLTTTERFSKSHFIGQNSRKKESCSGNSGSSGPCSNFFFWSGFLTKNMDLACRRFFLVIESVLNFLS